MAHGYNSFAVGDTVEVICGLGSSEYNVGEILVIKDIDHDIADLSGPDMVFCHGKDSGMYAKRFKPLKTKLEFPIIYHHKLWPEERRILLRGSEGKVSVFEENQFSADEWADEYVEKAIGEGMWIVESMGNVSCGDYLGEELI